MNAISSVAPIPEPSSASLVSPWCLSPGKRIFDLAVCIPALALALPLMGVLALVVKATSPGPALFRQRRLGQGGQPFVLLKFRSMIDGSHVTGPGVTQKGDLRVSSVGRFLRKSKLDELPQLFNVLRGDMSLVGPRPDLPEYFAAGSSECRAVLSLRPGLTGMASLTYRDEEEVLADIPQSELTHAYVTRVMPVKAALDIQYASKASFISDVTVLIRTAIAVLS
jgi:lipopolysaccharide/colanic/teichoic acid biosynthesis glycosyltransferase